MELKLCWNWALLILNTPPIFEFIYLFMKAKFSMFQQAVKFDSLVLANFQSFYWFVSYIFDKLAPFFQ